MKQLYFLQVRPFFKEEGGALDSKEIGFFKVGPLDDGPFSVTSAAQVHSKCDIKPLTTMTKGVKRGYPDENCIDPWLVRKDLKKTARNVVEKAMAEARIQWCVVSLLLPGSDE